MFEIVVILLIAFAIGYAVMMRVMSRSSDVLHGEFIEPPSKGKEQLAALLKTIQSQLRSTRPTGNRQ